MPPFLVRTILSENFDLARVIGNNDDVAIGVFGAGDVGRGLLGHFLIDGDLRVKRGPRTVLTRWFLGRGGRLLGVGRLRVLFDSLERYRRWITHIVDGVVGQVEDLLRGGWSRNGDGDDGRVRIQHFDGFLIRFVLCHVNGPNVCSAILAPTNDVPTIIGEAGSDLAGGVFVAAEFGLQQSGLEVVKSDARIIAGHQQLDFTVRIIGGLGHGVNPGDFISSCVATPGRPDLNLAGALQTIGVMNAEKPIQTSGDCMPTVWGERHCGDHIGNGGDERDILLRDVPQAQFCVKRTGQEEAIISGVKLYRGHEIGVLKGAETFSPTAMP